MEEKAKELGLRKGQYIFNLVEFMNRQADVADIFYISDETFDKLEKLYYNSLFTGKNE